jgi:hypothetical protein
LSRRRTLLLAGAAAAVVIGLSATLVATSTVNPRPSIAGSSSSKHDPDGGRGGVKQRPTDPANSAVRFGDGYAMPGLREIPNAGIPVMIETLARSDDPEWMAVETWTVGFDPDSERSARVRACIEQHGHAVTLPCDVDLTMTLTRSSPTHGRVVYSEFDVPDDSEEACEALGDCLARTLPGTSPPLPDGTRDAYALTVDWRLGPPPPPEHAEKHLQGIIKTLEQAVDRARLRGDVLSLRKAETALKHYQSIHKERFE